MLARARQRPRLHCFPLNLQGSELQRLDAITRRSRPLPRRLPNRYRDRGLLGIRGREICIKDLHRLQQLCGRRPPEMAGGECRVGP